MKILVLDAYFLPEKTSFTHLENDIMESLVKNGHELIVVCPTPTRGVDEKTAKEYAKIKDENLFGGKVTVKRFYAPREKKNFVSRAFRYFRCNLKTFRTAKKFRDVDLIFSNSTPPIQGLVARKLKKRLRVPFVYNLQDIFPDSLANAGLTKKNSLLYKIGRKIENKIYAAADKIIVISQAFKQNITAKGVEEDKITVVYNWVDTDKIKPVEREDNKLFDELGLDRKDFIVSYAGNFGVSQGIKVVVDAANILKDRDDIKFVLFGGGAEYDGIKAYAKSLGLKNLIINPLLSEGRVSEVYSLGSVNLITCKKGFGGAAFPSKTWSIMACNSPIVAAYDTDSELASVLNESGAGKVVEPENPSALANAILAAKDGAIKPNGRDFVLKHADKKICADKFAKAVCGAVKGEKVN